MSKDTRKKKKRDKPSTELQWAFNAFSTEWLANGFRYHGKKRRYAGRYIIYTTAQGEFAIHGSDPALIGRDEPSRLEPSPTLRQAMARCQAIEDIAILCKSALYEA